MRSRHPHLVKRRDRPFYQFHKKIPDALQGHYEGRKSIRISLKTGDYGEAQAKAQTLAAQWEDEFSALRSMLGLPPPPGGQPIRAAMLPKMAEALESSLGRHESAAPRTAAREDSAALRAEITGWMQSLHVGVALDSALGRYLARKFIEARIRLLGADATQAPGLKALIDELQPTRLAEDPRAPRLAAVVDHWEATGPRRARALGAAASLVRRFETLHGALPLSAITPAHFVALRDAMLTEVKPATVTAKFNVLRAAFAACIADRHLGLTANPLQHVKVRRDVEAARRQAFTAAQLQAIFDAPLFTARPWQPGERGSGGEVVGIGTSAIAYWLPLLGLFTGARLDELLHLKVGDLREVQGALLLHFRAHRPKAGPLAAAVGTAKPKPAREVPLHPELLRLGLLDYHAQRGDRGAWLLAGPGQSDGPAPLEVWSLWFGRLLDGVGLHDAQLMFHTFHHTFRDAGDRSGMPAAQRDAISGHAPSGRRGRPPPIAELAQALARLRFEGLDLSRVRPWPARR